MTRTALGDRAPFQPASGEASSRAGIFLTCLAGLCAAMAGCSKSPPPKEAIHVRPGVHLVKPERKTLLRTTGQPGFIEAYEQTSLYPKVSGYISAWKVDIGDKITKGQVLAVISVPELEAEYREKKAQAALDVVMIQVAEEMVAVATENVKTATAQIGEARAAIAKSQADIDRWESEVTRLGSLTDAKVINQQILSESRKQLKANIAARDAAQASVLAAQATEAARKADVSKARVDVEAARARAKVTAETVQKLAALVSYTEIHAPYDGIVLIRNVNEGDYVQPSTGDSSGLRSIQDKANSKGTPLYVVARTDIVRIFLDVPEMDANGVGPGSPATVRIQAVDNGEFHTTVTRTSWGLYAQTRTLRAEVDLKNPTGLILPNMYAYGQVEVKRPNVWALPIETVVEIGNQNCCYIYDNGKAFQTPVQTGINDGKWVEITRKRTKGNWVPIDGKEQVIEADLSGITDGQGVRVETEQDKGSP
jgi:RND family efflux transporter MFP subunit